jgi:hypothetical protein
MLGAAKKEKKYGKKEKKKYVDTLDLTSYLPKFLPDLKNCDGAGVAASTEVVERS